MLAERYLDLLKSILVNETYVELEAQLLMSVICAAKGLVMGLPDFQALRDDRAFLDQLLQAKQSGETILLDTVGNPASPGAEEGLRNYTEFSFTLVGRKRLDHLQGCVDDVLDREVPGDLLEAGVWRGGCCILMRAVLEARSCGDRRVWAADSFSGLPAPETEQDSDYTMDATELPVLAVTRQEVEENFRRFDLLDEQVRFLPGWFEDSLPDAQTGPLSLLRVDCDLYSSTRTVLETLYPRVSRGGWVIIDDYGILPPCQLAVDEYRAQHGISAEFERIDSHAVCWRVG